MFPTLEAVSTIGDQRIFSAIQLTYEQVLLYFMDYKELAKYNRDAARNAIEQVIPLYKNADVKMKSHKCEEEVIKLPS